MSGYLVIPRLDIRSANAQPAWWIVGAPALTAFHGFAYALGLSTNAKINGIGVIHHDIDFLGEELYGDLFPYNLRAAGFIDENDYGGDKQLPRRRTPRRWKRVQP